MDKYMVELIVIGVLFLISSWIAYVRARRRPQQNAEEASPRRPWATRDYVLTLVAFGTMLIFLGLYIWLAFRELLR
jgi:predicted CDP-diglyceride synthetase/phosphatidate cytidylyltransferase